MPMEGMGDQICDWDQIQVLPLFYDIVTTSLFAQGKKDKIQHVLESLIQTAEQYQIATAATTSYGLRLGHISTC
jgi:hypothetical protein